MSNECPNCGFPLGIDHFPCEKCGEDPATYRAKQIDEVDIAHGGETWERAREKMAAAVDRAKFLGFKGIKIVHGRGVGGHTSVIKHRAIPEMRHLARRYGAKLVPDKHTDGAHLLYF